jgi:hypothetical protein
MGELRPGRSEQPLFEVFDAVQELLFNVEQIPNGYRFMTSGLECASMSKGLSGLKTRAGGDYTVVEVSNAVPTNLFIRQMILATALAVLLATGSS